MKYNFENIINFNNRTFEYSFESLVKLIEESTGFYIPNINKELECFKIEIIGVESSKNLYSNDNVSFIELAKRFRTIWLTIQALAFSSLCVYLSINIGFKNIPLLFATSIIPLGWLTAVIFDISHRIRYNKKTWRKNFA